MRSASSSPSIGERPHAEHAVLALQLHAHALGNVVRHQRRNADAEIDVKAVAQLLGGARGHLVAGPGHQTSPRSARRRACASVRCSMRFCGVGHVHDALHENAGREDVVGIDLAGLNEMLDLGDRDLAGRRHHRIEVARGLAVDEIALGVALPGVHDGEMSATRPRSMT